MYLILTLVATFLATPVRAEPVDTNTLGADTMAKAMMGVGPTLTMAILDYRAALGVFERVYEFVKVRKIGMALIKKNRDSITVGTDLESDC